MPGSMAIGVAVVGSGIFVREEHLPAIGACKDLDLKAVYSRSLKTVQSLLQGRDGIDAYSDDSGVGKTYKDLLARSDVQAIVIALPILAQPQYIKEALLASKHVLSEKPIAGDLKQARELIEWYEQSIDPSKASWSVAENMRFMNSFDYAADHVAQLGRVLTFRCRWQTSIQAGNRYYETQWRKTPSFQGGFLLDGGVHFVAVLRLLLGSDYVTRLSGYSTQLQAHLPPVDTVEAAAKTSNGALGTISLSAGTTAVGNEWIIGCERGSLYLSRETVKITIDGKEEAKEVPNEKTGVAPEIRAWGSSILARRPDRKQSPREALADLELVCSRGAILGTRLTILQIETLLQSGEKNGTPIDLVHQKVDH
jgi:predicted dehydrogenase